MRACVLIRTVTEAFQQSVLFFSYDTPINGLQLWFRSWWLDTAQLWTAPGGESWVLRELFLLTCILARSCWTLHEQSASPQDQWQCWIHGLITCYILIRQVFRRQSSLMLCTTTQYAWEKCYFKIAYSQYALTVILEDLEDCHLDDHGGIFYISSRDYNGHSLTISGCRGDISTHSSSASCSCMISLSFITLVLFAAAFMFCLHYLNFQMYPWTLGPFLAPLLSLLSTLLARLSSGASNWLTISQSVEILSSCFAILSYTSLTKLIFDTTCVGLEHFWDIHIL